MMKFKERENQRVYLTFYLRIFEGQKFLGYMIDISNNGLMVMSDYQLEEGKSYNLRMKLPSSAEWENDNIEDRCILFNAECRWSKHDDVDKEFYLSGFSFPDLSAEDGEIIGRLIHDFRIK